jgi:5-methyltetrahydrofolate--homocysteine methyltransferase
MSKLLKKLANSIEEGDEEKVKNYCRLLLEKGAEPTDIIERGMVEGMRSLGQKFERKGAFISDLLMAGAAFEAGMEVLKPLITRVKRKERLGRIVLGTVQGDLHYIGKRLVAIVLETEGFEVIDIGEDVSPDEFATSTERTKADILGMSCLLSTTAGYMKQVIEELEKRGIRKKVKIMIGGAAVDEEFARTIGADAYAPDAFRAVDVARKLLRR